MVKVNIVFRTPQEAMLKNSPRSARRIRLRVRSVSKRRTSSADILPSGHGMKTSAGLDALMAVDQKIRGKIYTEFPRWRAMHLAER